MLVERPEAVVVWMAVLVASTAAQLGLNEEVCIPRLPLITPLLTLIPDPYLHCSLYLLSINTPISDHIFTVLYISSVYL